MLAPRSLATVQDMGRKDVLCSPTASLQLIPHHSCCLRKLQACIFHHPIGGRITLEWSRCDPAFPD